MCLRSSCGARVRTQKGNAFVNRVCPSSPNLSLNLSRLVDLDARGTRLWSTNPAGSSSVWASWGSHRGGKGERKGEKEEKGGERGGMESISRVY